MIVIVLGKGRTRFRDLRTAVEGHQRQGPHQVRSRDLERDGLISRHVFAEVPPRVEYELTDLGRTLHGPLSALGEWAEAHIVEVLDAREQYDRER